MTFDAEALQALLPAIHRIRDHAIATDQGLDEGPQAALLAVMAEQIAVVEENLAQLHDDLFIETCAEWVSPYIGDLIGYRPLHGVVPRVASPRAEVAHTIALRRRKGTALVLEQLARDVTGWPARAVELFQLLSTTQYMNHPRPHALRTPDLRDPAVAERAGGAFDEASHTADVRHIESGAVRHNIPNIAIFLWRIDAHPHHRTPTVRAAGHHHRISPLGHDVAVYNRPADPDLHHQATPEHVPHPITRRELRVHLASHYGSRPTAGAPIDNHQPALVIEVDGTTIERDHVDVCDLRDDGAGWAHTPPAGGRVAVDPELGRIALPLDIDDPDSDPAQVRVTWHRGFVAEIGGGEYERGTTLPAPAAGTAVVRVPDDHATLADALAAITGDGVVEVTDNGRHPAPTRIDVAAGGHVEIRAANGQVPTVVLDQPLEVRGGADARATLNGLWLAGDRLEVPDDAGNALARLAVIHSTLVPGLDLTVDGAPASPEEPSLVCRLPDTDVVLERCIVGALRLGPHGRLEATDTVVDATAAERVALAAPDGDGPAATVWLQACTVVGKVHAAEIDEVSDCIVLAAMAPGDPWPAPVRAARTQVGCVRFSFAPSASILPRRHRCQPADERIAPAFTSLRFGTPAYAQLAATTPAEIRRGAESESEMGALHHLYAPQRHVNLRIRLEEYLRAGLRAGVIHES